ncbi:MAG: hypothetical protein AVDCRST_MAG64-126, partial [uncultured Phycisphaerae bacterium]
GPHGPLEGIRRSYRFVRKVAKPPADSAGASGRGVHFFFL